jgi:hypothetical protein
MTGTTASLTGIQIEAFSGSGSATTGGAAVAGSALLTSEAHAAHDELPVVIVAPHFSHCKPGTGGGGAPMWVLLKLRFFGAKYIEN